MFRFLTCLFCLLLLSGLAFRGVDADDTECDLFASHLTNASTSFMTIGQLSDSLLVITGDQKVYDLPAANLESSRLLLNGANAQALGTKWPFIATDDFFRTYFSIGSYIIIQTKPSAKILFGFLRRDNTQFSFMLCQDHPASCSTSIIDKELPYRFEKNFPFINSQEEDTFYTLAKNHSIIKYAFNGTSIVQLGSPLYLCLKDSTDVVALLTFSNQACNGSSGFELAEPLQGFKGLTKNGRMYLFGAKIVYSFEWPTIFEPNLVVGVSKVARKDFFQCKTEADPTSFLSAATFSTPIWIIVGVFVGLMVLIVVFVFIIVRARKFRGQILTVSH